MVDNLEGLEQDLYSATVALLLAVELVGRLDGNPENTLTPAEWETVYWQSMLANEQAKLVLDVDDGLDCEALALEILDDPLGTPFPLRHALEKLTSLPRHVESLISFAHSPRFRPALQCGMSIFCIPNQSRSVQLPTSRKERKTLLETAFGGHHPSQGAHAVMLSQRLRFQNYTCPAYCECALIQYLQVKHYDEWDNIRPFGYIGISKLSCSACRTRIEAFNEQSGAQFYTRGSHGKWYWPWGMPRDESLEEVEEAEEPLDSLMPNYDKAFLRGQQGAMSLGRVIFEIRG